MCIRDRELSPHTEQGDCYNNNWRVTAVSRLLLQLLQHYSNEQGNCCNNWRVTAVSRVTAATECYISKPGNCYNWGVTAVSR